MHTRVLVTEGRRHGAAQVAFVLAFAMGGCSSNATESASSVRSVRTPIVRGAVASTDAAVVYIAIQRATNRTEQTSFGCTGVVVSPHVVLTAAHCVHPKIVKDGQTWAVFTGPDIDDDEQFSDRKNFHYENSVHYDDAWDPSKFELVADVVRGGHDLGAIVVEEAFDVTPLPILREPLSDDAVGTKLRAVGYGMRTAGSSASSGQRFGAELTLSALNEETLSFATTSSTPSLCEGDSGGPTLVRVGEQDYVVGVHSWVEHAKSCTGVNVDSRIDRHVAAFLDPIIAKADPDFVMKGSSDGAGDGDTDAGSVGAHVDAGTTSNAAAPAGSTSQGCSLARAGRDDDSTSSVALSMLALASSIRRRSRSRS